MPINLLVVPQVIPHAQYLEHLQSARSTPARTPSERSRPCRLARLHPDVTSWSAAAEALNMPGQMGVRLARACSATMLVSADEWEARIWRAGEETRRRDYRATEAKIKHRLYMSRWFNEWARQSRPGTPLHQRWLRPDLAVGPRRPRPPRPLTRLARQEAHRQRPPPVPPVRGIPRRAPAVRTRLCTAQAGVTCQPLRDRRRLRSASTSRFHQVDRAGARTAAAAAWSRTMAARVAATPIGGSHSTTSRVIR
jgi:hypothetical protein